MAGRERVYSGYTREALALLGRQTQLARKQLGWSEQALADRAGVDRGTVRKVEAGNPRVAVGISLEVASLVGMPLFAEDASALAFERRSAEQLLALLPKKIQPKRQLDDDF